jgi:hypothetical protein
LYVIYMLWRQVDWEGSGSCPIAGFSISDVESTALVLVVSVYLKKEKCFIVLVDDYFVCKGYWESGADTCKHTSTSAGDSQQPTFVVATTTENSGTWGTSICASEGTAHLHHPESSIHSQVSHEVDAMYMLTWL